MFPHHQCEENIACNEIMNHHQMTQTLQRANSDDHPMPNLSGKYFLSCFESLFRVKGIELIRLGA